MKQNTTLYLFFCCCIVSFFSFSATAHAEQQPFKVGMILPLTGATADYGDAIKNCVQLAQRDRPELFGNIEFLYEDAQYDPKLAVSAFHKLRTIDKASVIYSWGVSFCKALSPLAEQYDIVLVNQCIDGSSSKNRKNVVRLMNHTDEYLLLLATYLKKQNKNNLAIVVSENPYLEEMLASLHRSLQQGQTITTVERLPVTEMDFRSILAKLKKDSPDAIGIFLSAGQIATFYKQARSLQLKIPTFGTNFFESLSEIKAADGAMDGAVYSFNEVKPEFTDRYKKLFGNESQLGFGALGYEFALLAGEIASKLHREGILNADQFLEELSKIKARDGIAAGPYSFTENDVGGKYLQYPLVIKQIQGDRIERVE